MLLVGCGGSLSSLPGDATSTPKLAGSLTVFALLASLHGSAVPADIVLPTELVVRGSTVLDASVYGHPTG